jgi:hypothetical protein
MNFGADSVEAVTTHVTLCLLPGHLPPGTQTQAFIFTICHAHLHVVTSSYELKLHDILRLTASS